MSSLNNCKCCMYVKCSSHKLHLRTYKNSLVFASVTFKIALHAMCSLRSNFICLTTSSRLSIIIFQQQDLLLLWMQTLHSAHKLRQQWNISSLSRATVKLMSKLQHITLNDSENRIKLQHILSSEIQDQVTARNLYNSKTKNHVTAHVIGSRRLMPPDAQKPNAYCTNPGL